MQMLFLLACAKLSKVASSTNLDFARAICLNVASPALSLGKALVEALSRF